MSSSVEVLPPNKEGLLQEAMDLLFESSKEGLAEEDYWEDSFEMDELISHVQSVLEQQQGSHPTDDTSVEKAGDGIISGSVVSNDDMTMNCSVGSGAGNSSSSSSSRSSSSANPTLSNSMLKTLDEFYQKCHEKSQGDDLDAEFKRIEDFVLEEQASSRNRRFKASQLEASEEKRLAAEVAQLRGLRLKSQNSRGDDDLRWKVSDAERSFINRKMVYAKATQVAGSDLRAQFVRVRAFLDQLHESRQQSLYREHRRSLNYQALMHALKKSEPRVVSLDRQIALRLFRKKKADLTESHMKQTLLEAEYIEKLMNTLDTVQSCKETAARELFDLHVTNLKSERKNNERRQDEMELLIASGTLEMAKLVAAYTAEGFDDQENDEKLQERVARMERKNNREISKGGGVSVSWLYDTVLYSATNETLGLTTTGSSLYSSDYGSITESDDEDDGDGCDVVEGTDAGPSEIMDIHEDDEGDATSPPQCQTPVGRIHARRLAREALDGKARRRNSTRKT